IVLDGNVCGVEFTAIFLAAKCA
ncbi:MAG: hypothetical protein QOJ06_1, partial [Pseudonocardiales bacterium]|nr:hypothetical protein [Pseudonocardiales bacterium]